MRRITFVLVASIMLLGLAGCNQVGSSQAVHSEVLQSDKPRDTSPAVDQADLAALVDGNNAFAFDLYQTLRQEEGNLFLSPYSISEALAMAYAGARGDTEKDMAQVLNFNLPQESLHPAWNSLDLQLNERNQSAEQEDGEGFQLNVVNAIWGQQGYHFLEEYLDLLAQHYGAGLRLMDFISETEQSRIAINRWVSDQTEDKIKDLIPQGAINEMTRLVLTNAIYFNASWHYSFDDQNTKDRPFYLLDGGQVEVPMMQQTASLGYAEGVNYQAVELLYEGEEISMVILLPEAGQFDTFEESLDADLVKEITGKLSKLEVILKMPKFEYEDSFSLKQALSTMGMEVAFTQADFSGINGKNDLCISDVLHKAFVHVDESGTEAAAATAVIFETIITSVIPQPQPKEVTIDRPFIFLIRDIPTGSTIFIGRVLNPVAQ
jgi:serpin B